MAFTSGQKSVRILQFLRGLGSRSVARPLKAHGFTAADMEEGWRLLKAAFCARLDQRNDGADPEVVAELDAWENHWFPVALATLSRGYPKVAQALFLNLAQANGIEAVITVGTFVERLRRAQREGTEEDRQALALLARRGLTEAVIAEAEALIATLESVPEVDADEDDSAERAAAEQAAWAWYLEWSIIARKAISDRRALRELGFLRGSRGTGADEELDELEELIPPSATSPTTGAPTTANSPPTTAPLAAPPNPGQPVVAAT